MILLHGMVSVKHCIWNQKPGLKIKYWRQIPHVRKHILLPDLSLMTLPWKKKPLPAGAIGAAHFFVFVFTENWRMSLESTSSRWLGRTWQLGWLSCQDTQRSTFTTFGPLVLILVLCGLSLTIHVVQCLCCTYVSSPEIATLPSPNPWTTKT